MRKDLIKSYNYMRKRIKINNSMDNVDRFFSGLKQFSEFGVQKKYDFNIKRITYSLRYAIVIFLIGIIVFISVFPSVHKLYVDAQYKKLLYKELIHSYFDNFDINYIEKKSQYNNYLINLNNDSFLPETY